MLSGCDVNKDVEIDGIMQLTLPDFQMKLFEKALSGYVKVVESKVCYGLEDKAAKPNKRLPTAWGNEDENKTGKEFFNIKRQIQHKC